MYCKNCGNMVPDGIKFCNRCGAQMPPPAAYPPRGGASYTPPTPPPYTPPRGGGFGGSFGGAYGGIFRKGNKDTWLAIAFVLVVLPIIAIFCNGIFLRLSSDYTIYYNMISAVRYMENAKVWYILYIIFGIIDVILYMATYVMILKKKSTGILLGLAGSVLWFIITVLMLIIGFCTAPIIMGAGTSVTSCPGTWIWISLPLSILNVAFFAVKGKDLVA